VSSNTSLFDAVQFKDRLHCRTVSTSHNASALHEPLCIQQKLAAQRNQQHRVSSEGAPTFREQCTQMDTIYLHTEVPALQAFTACQHVSCATSLCVAFTVLHNIYDSATTMQHTQGRATMRTGKGARRCVIRLSDRACMQCHCCSA
jgi:hypothetical protein